MTLSLIDKKILDRREPEVIEEDMEPILSVAPLINIDEEKVGEADGEIYTQREKDVLHTVDRAVLASQGVRKMLDVLYGKSATVTVDKENEALQGSLERIFGEQKSSITFGMYKEALAILENESFKAQEEVIASAV